MLAGTVDTRERLFVKQANESVLPGNALQRQHRELLMIGRDVRCLEDRCDLVLTRRDLVVPRLDRHAKSVELLLDLQHVRQNAVRDGTEVVVVELLSLRRLRAEERASRVDQVGATVEVLFIDQEVLLLSTHRRRHAVNATNPEELEHAPGRLVDRLHRAEQRRLVVERFAGPRCEGGRDGEVGTVLILNDERRGGRIPCRVAARLERRAHAAGRKARRIRLTLDQILAGELCDGAATLVRCDEAVVLLGRGAGERLEPVRVVRRASLDGPLFHRDRDRIRDR